MPATSSIISDDAVIVAMVAEPVARRISTASTHASSSTETLASRAQSASRVPMPVSTSTCLKPPPAETISRMPAIGGSADDTVSESCSRSMPDADAEGDHRDEHPDQQRDERVADHVEDLLDAVVGVVDDDVDDRLAEHQHDRQQDGRDGDGERRPAVLGDRLALVGPAS